MKPVYRKDMVVTIDSVKTGEAVQKYRESKRVRAVEVFRKMKVSQAYYYALEAGRRDWSEDLLKRAIDAIDKLAGKVR